MKRFFVILIMLMLVGATYADGPRYRFKSRRALQSLWRNEMAENAKDVRTGKGRKLSVRELQGESSEEENNKRAYGVVVADPFSDAPSSGKGLFSTTGTKGAIAPGTIGGNGGTTTGGGGGRPFIDLPDLPGDDPDPTAGGSVGSGGQGGYAPPKTPVGDGLCCMIILSAMLIAIKKRLSK